MTLTGKFRAPMVLSMVAVLAVAGCTDPDYLTGSNSGQGSKARDGAIIGGIIGGVIGGTRGGDNRLGKAAVGAAIGAGVGGLIGHELDKQAADLRGSVQNSDIEIVNTGAELIVIMPQGILFDTDSAVVKSGVYGDLGALSENLRNYPNSVVNIIGHTDNTGSAAHNFELSLSRARSVTAIIQNNGVAGSRLNAIGRGDDEPKASNLTPEGRAQNRRVEIVIRPTQ